MSIIIIIVVIIIIIIIIITIVVRELLRRSVFHIQVNAEVRKEIERSNHLEYLVVDKWITFRWF